MSKGAFEKSSKEHAVFARFLRTTPVPRGGECGFCHSPYHKKEMGSLSMEVCARCHTFVRDTLAGKSEAPMNIHDTFQEKACTACHDPHAAPYQHVLKEPAEKYLPREQNVPQISSRPSERAY
jgi:predicted CXXCH cytochrome family protein